MSGAARVGIAGRDLQVVSAPRHGFGGVGSRLLPVVSHVVIVCHAMVVCKPCMSSRSDADAALYSHLTVAKVMCRGQCKYCTALYVLWCAVLVRGSVQHNESYGVWAIS